jgi:hypothetical protein
VRSSCSESPPKRFAIGRLEREADDRGEDRRRGEEREHVEAGEAEADEAARRAATTS